MENNWYVITGAPCSGKTTLLDELRRMGYTVVPEAAREIIDEDLAQGKSLESIRRDVLAFQRRIIARKQQIKKTLSPSDTIFFDRGLPDSRAFLAHHGIPEPEDVAKELDGSLYKKVFILEPLPYASDYARTEEADEQKSLHKTHIETYKSLGYVPVMVPVMPVPERAAYVLDRLS